MEEDAKYMEEMEQDVQQKVQELEEEDAVAKMHNFYSMTLKKGGKWEISLDPLRIIDKLRELGFFRFDTEDGGYQYVRIKNNRITIVNDTQIKDAFESYICQLPDYEAPCVMNDEVVQTKKVTRRMIQEVLYRNINYYFSSTLDRLRPVDNYGHFKPIKILRDSRNVKYLYFKNCAVRIENRMEQQPDGKLKQICEHEELPYSMIEGGCIWENSIIDRKFEYTTCVGDYEYFCYKISGDSEKRLRSLMSILGYLMHDNYECDLRAALFTDVNLENNTNAAGRTGKGLLAKGLSHVLNRNELTDCIMINVPGKGFEATNPKRYSAGDLSTQLVHIEDLNKKFVLDDLYGDITDNAVFQKHYQNPTYKRIKIMLSMNQALRLSGSSDRGRVVVFELANFFSDKNRPADFFGARHKVKQKRFFCGDWSQQDWNDFYSFMVRCCETYLLYGIIEPEDVNFEQRAAQEAVGSKDAWAFFEETFGGINPGVRAAWEKRSLYTTYCNKYPGEFSQQKYFSTKIQIYLQAKKIPSASTRDGKDWFVLYPTQEEMHKSSSEIIYNY